MNASRSAHIIPRPQTTLVLIGTMALWLTVPGPVHGTTPVLPAPNDLPGCTIASPHLQSWWKGEGDAADSWGPNPGTILGTTQFTEGYVGQAFSFDSDDDGVQIPRHPSIDPSEQLTVEFWVWAPTNQDGATAGRATVVDKSHSGADQTGWVFELGLGGSPSDQLGFGIYTRPTQLQILTTPRILSDDPRDWWHIAGTYDGSTVKLYFNGELCDQAAQVGTIATNLRNTLLGYWLNDGVGARQRFFRGKVDELSIYDRALTDDDIQAIYLAGRDGKCEPFSCGQDPCVAAPENVSAWWNAERTVEDVLGAQTMLRDLVSYGGGVVCDSFVFDGVDDGISIADAPRLHQSEQLSVELWIQGIAHEQDFWISGTGGFVTFVDKSHAGGDSTGWYLQNMLTSGFLEFGVYRVDGTVASATSQINVLDGDWHHIVTTYDGATARVYADGNLQYENSFAPGLIAQNERPINIGFWNGGAAGGGASRFFRGRIDEVSVYSRALSEAEIDSIHDAGSGGKCDPCAGGPQITRVVPAEGDACCETQVIIEGSGFCDVQEVRFEPNPAAWFNVLDPWTIVAAVQPHPHVVGPIDVKVDSATLPGGFTYLAEPPEVTSIDPSSGPYTGTSVMIRGEHFCPQVEVFFGREPAQYVIVHSNTLIEALTPVRLPGGCETQFSVPVKVTNPDGKCDIGPNFTYQPSATLRVGPLTGDFTSVQSAIDSAVAAGQNGFAVLIDPAIGLLTEDNIDPRGKTVFFGSTNPDGRPRLKSTVVSRRVFRIAGATSNVVLSCLTLMLGGVEVSSGARAVLHRCEIHDHLVAMQDGGGVLVQGGASGVLVECSIHTNKAPRGGGVAYLGSGTSGAILNCAIVLNEASQGGGVYVGDGVEPILIAGDSTVPEIGLDAGIRFNQANGAGGGTYLGALSSGSSGEHRLNGLEIYWNDASGLGGGVFLSGASRAAIRDCYIAYNNPDRSKEDRTHAGGGGVACDASAAQSTLLVTDCILEGNRADGQCAMGGAIFMRCSPTVGEALCVLKRNIVCGNVAQVGGGIALDTKVNGQLFRNVIAENNVARCLVDASEAIGGGGGDACVCSWQPTGGSPTADVFGAGVFERDSRLVLVNNTIHRNMGTEADSGGGLHGLTGFFEDSKARNNIFSENSGYGVHLVVASGCSANIGYNDFWMNAQGPFFPGSCVEWSGNGNLFLDPMFESPNDCAGLGLTDGSPCIDAGDPDTRVPPGGGLVVDMGAIEESSIDVDLQADLGGGSAKRK